MLEYTAVKSKTGGQLQVEEAWEAGSVHDPFGW